MNQEIYLDYAATQPMAAEAMAAMEQAMEDVYGNASAVYRTAARAKQLLEQSREIIAETIGASPEEIFFTSGGTESDNWALNAAADRAAGQDGSDEIRFRTGAQIRPQIITTPIEHHAILHTLSYLQISGRAEAVYADVDEAGRVNQEAVCSRITPQTALVSVMMANNEIGTIEPIREIARRVHDAEERQILFHTDAVQAYGKIPIDVRRDGIDLMSVSAHKIGGPKGIGFLYIRQGVRFGAFLHGGMQERGRRAGTENVPAAAGFAAAAKAAVRHMEEEERRERALQQIFLEELRRGMPDLILNGPPIGPERLANNINVSIPGINADSALIALDLEGIAASAGSACTTGAVQPSHVLTAIGADRARAKSALRFTVGPATTEEKLYHTAQVLTAYWERIRSLGDEAE